MLGFCCEHWKPRLAEVPGALWLARAGLVVFAASLALMLLGIQTKSLVIAGGSVSLVCGYLPAALHPARCGRINARRRIVVSMVRATVPERQAAAGDRRAPPVTVRVVRAVRVGLIVAGALALPATAAAPPSLITFARTIGNHQAVFSIQPDGTRLLWENYIERLVVGWVDNRAAPKALTRGTLADWG